MSHIIIEPTKRPTTKKGTIMANKGSLKCKINGWSDFVSRKFDPLELILMTTI